MAKYLRYELARNLPTRFTRCATPDQKRPMPFMQKKHLTVGIRTSLENFGQLRYEDSEGLRLINIIPIYAIGKLTIPFNYS